MQTITINRETKEILKRLSEMPLGSVLKVNEKSFSAYISRSIEPTTFGTFTIDGKEYSVPKMTIKHSKYVDVKNCEGIICQGLTCSKCIMSSEYLFNNYIKSLKL